METITDIPQEHRDQLLAALEKANSTVERSMTLISQLEERLRRVRDDETEEAEITLSAEAFTPKWEWETVTYDPQSTHRETARIAQMMNEGWQVHSTHFQQSAVLNDGVLEVIRTQVVNLQRVIFEHPAPVDPKEEGKEATLLEVIASPDGLGTPSLYDEEPSATNEETVIEPELEPVPVIQVLPGNFAIVDCLPDDLIVEREAVAEMSYAEAIKNPFTTKEDLQAIHRRTTEARVKVAREDYRARWEEKKTAWAEKWKHAGMPFEVHQWNFGNK